MIQVLNSKFSNFLYISSGIHFFCLIFFLISGSFDFVYQNKVLEMNSSDRVIVRVGQIRNTRMKEHDKKMASNLAAQAVTKNKSSNLNRKEAVKPSPKITSQIANSKQTNTPQTPPLQRINSKAPELKQTAKTPAKAVSAVSPLPSQPNKKCKPCKNKNKNKKKSIQPTTSHFLENTRSSSQSVTSNESVSLSSTAGQYVIQNFEDIASLSSFQECNSLTQVHELQFKNDVIEFIKVYWDFPDYLLGTDISIPVEIAFDKNGFITHYKIYESPQKNKEQEQADLLESIMKLLNLMKTKPLPVAGRRLKFNAIKLNFLPIHN